MNSYKNPAISIVLPSYNGEKYLKQALDSITRQTYKDFELILVNDCSTDGTREIMEEAAQKDERIRVIHNERNRKLPASLNIGFSVSRGGYMTWTSDDNIMDENALEVMAQSIQRNNVDIVWCDFYMIDSTGRLLGKTDFSQYKVQDLLYMDIVGACFLYRRQVYETLNGFRENCFLVEDYDFWVRAYKCGYKFEYIHQLLYCYRIHGNSLTGKRYREKRLKDIPVRAKNLLYKSDIFTKGKIFLNISEAYRINQMWGRAVLYKLAAYLCGIKE